ncbi:conserved hypothetical protein [Trichinella spiralis]|uniref:histone H2AV n=1 Tax=Trichinella spiralis TaxID=6334 RepID=UPI0001EFC825|nr:histone H2AV [Trichinella spiralis]XP_003381148.1 conserved hypothetical protein [Trichinella spiralis]
MCTLYVSNCNQEQVKYLRMFVMPHLEQTDVNTTKHGVQSENTYSNSIHVTLASSSYLINQNQYLLMNDTICEKQRHTGTARKCLYVHANTGCNGTSFSSTTIINKSYSLIFVISHWKRSDSNKHQYVVRICTNAARLTQGICYNYNPILLTFMISETTL